jgi:hypothetical protein
MEKSSPANTTIQSTLARIASLLTHMLCNTPVGHRRKRFGP